MTGLESIRPGQHAREILVAFASLIQECPSTIKRSLQKLFSFKKAFLMTNGTLGCVWISGGVKLMFSYLMALSKEFLSSR